MNRRIFLHLSGPAALIGVVLFAAAIGTAWSIQRLQRNLTSILAENVTSLEVAQELEINIRRVRFNAFMLLMDPQPNRRALFEESHRDFESSLAMAKLYASNEREAEIVKRIETQYSQYQKEVREDVPPDPSNIANLVKWVEKHPVRILQGPSDELLRYNKNAMEETARESETVGRQTRLAVLAVGILGPICGLIVGAIVARAWSRSIARLSVRLQDMHSQLTRNAGEMSVELGDDWDALDRQIDLVVGRVKEAAAKIQTQHQDLLRSEQLAAVGQLAASVAHEIRNPLTSIKILVGLALRPSNPQSLTTQDLRVIHDEVEKLESTVQGLLDYARPPQVERRETELHSVVEQAVNLVRPKAEQQGVSINFAPSPKDTTCRIDPVQMGHVVVNLLINAVDALPGGGIIDVAIERTEQGGFELRVADDGHGVPQEQVDKLFVPFASSKPTGTGLGLNICQRIVRDHQGMISYEPRAGGGSQFVVVVGEPETDAAPNVSNQKMEVLNASLAHHR